MNRKLCISLFDSSKHAQPSDILEITWDEFAEGLQAAGHEQRATKDGEAMVFGRVEGGRKDSDVVHRDGTALDFDHLDPEAFTAAQAVVKQLEDEGIAFVEYDTYSWTQDDPRFRVVIPFDRPISDKKEWARAMQGLQRKVGRRPKEPTKWLNDPATCSYSRLFYLPASSTGGGSLRVVKGRPMRVEDLLNFVDITDVIMDDFSPMPLDSDEFHELGLRLQKRDRPAARRAGGILLAASRRKTLPLDPGERNNSLFSAIGYIARDNPFLKPESVGAVFSASLALMRAETPDDPPPDETAIADMYERLSAKVREEAAQKQQPTPELPAAAKYSEDELKAIYAAQQNDNPPWIISTGRKTWFLTQRGYEGPYDAEQFHHVQTILARAPISLWVEKADGGWRLRTYAEFLAWDQKINNFTASLLEPINRFDPTTGTLYEAAGVRSKLRSHEWPEVHAWLLKLGGEAAEHLLDWIAAASMQDKTSAILYLEGPPRSGKTLLANGLAKIWEYGFPVPFSSFNSDFNGLAKECPLILADEGVSGKNVSNLLREMCGVSGFTIRRKFLPDAKLLGSPRLIITANNPDVLRIKTAHTRDDQEALAQRFLHIKVGDDAGSMLPGGTDWLEHKIAEHALWLAETRQIKPGNRFFIDGGGRRLLDHIAIAGDETATVLELVMSWLMHGRCRDGWRVIEGELWISTVGLSDDLMQKGYRIGPHTIGRSIGSVSDIRKQFRVNQKVVTFKRVDLARMKAWLERDGYMEWSAFMDLLIECEKPSKKDN